MGSDQVVRDAEREVLEAAKAWSREAPWQGRRLSPAEERLKMAVFMLGKARTITGSIRVLPEPPRAPQEEEIPDEVKARDPRREE